jgi:hypothetical protein
LVITGITTDADGGISALTCSGAGSDVDAILAHDVLRFNDGVSGKADVRYRSWIGHKPVDVPVQIRATADATSVTDSVVVSIFPKLYSASSNKQNVDQTIVVGMELSALPSHRCGFICGGDALFVAMPSLPDEDPFTTIRSQDTETGAAIRMYSGSKFGLNERGTVHDGIWGKVMVPNYAMRIAFPL